MNKKMKVTVLQCGEVLIDSSALFREKSAFYPWCMTGLFRGKKHQLRVPAFSFLIEHPDGYKVVYDTSWGSGVRKHSWKELGIGRLVDTPILPEGAGVNEKIAQAGYKNCDIDYVVLSHMHIDHAGGLQDLKGAKHFLVSKSEYDAAMSGGSYRKHMWKDIPLEFMQYTESEIGPYNISQDLFGDGKILLVATPGHTPGHTSILLHNNDKELLLSGDNGYARKSWRDGILPGLMKDPERMKKSLAWVKKYAKEHEKSLIDVISDHETEIDQYVYEF